MLCMLILLEVKSALHMKWYFVILHLNIFCASTPSWSFHLHAPTRADHSTAHHVYLRMYHKPCRLTFCSAYRRPRGCQFDSGGNPSFSAQSPTLLRSTQVKRESRAYPDTNEVRVLHASVDFHHDDAVTDSGVNVFLRGCRTSTEHEASASI